MNQREAKPLFELSCADLERELTVMFEPLRAEHPIRCQVVVALMAAQATTQRLALAAFRHMNDEVQSHARDAEVLGSVFETVEAINEYMLAGEPSRIDLMLWDTDGYIGGWFVNQHGRPDTQMGSCPQLVSNLSAALQILAQHESDWRPALERYADGLVALLRSSREKAEVRARANVDSQGWLKKHLSPTTAERELISLGFV
jgi:hypothetical protein